MAQYNREIKKWVRIILDKYIIYNEFNLSKKSLGIEEMYILMRWDDGITSSEFLQFYGYERKKGQKIIDLLLQEKLIEKKRDSLDKRKRCLYRTPLGAEQADHLNQAYSDTIDSLLVDLSLNEEKSVLKFISKIYQMTQNKYTPGE